MGSGAQAACPFSPVPHPRFKSCVGGPLSGQRIAVEETGEDVVYVPHVGNFQDAHGWHESAVTLIYRPYGNHLVYDSAQKWVDVASTHSGHDRRNPQVGRG